MFGKKRKKEQEVKTFFNEQWKEEELIGEGSYGKVYKAKKEEFGIATYSAIKQIEIPQTKAEIQTLKTEGMTQNDITSYYENTVQKWVEEIKFMSIFKDSENIVTIEDYEINKKKNEIGWIINIRMELLKNLDAYILENNITDKEILKMAIDVATALEDCEENNVVHRDIKPDNIFVNKKGIYKVGDFGIAKHIEKTVSNMSKKGTENYMAPELYKNEKGNRTVDIYSLGIMLYRYFNYNRLPFLPNYPEKITIDSREEALYKRISGEKMPAPQNAPREIAEIILKACSYYPKDRYSSATELKTDLQKVYDQIDKPKTLFDFNEKQMNKLFIENTKSDSHNGTLSVFEDETAKDKLEMTVGIGVNEIVNEQINVEQIPEQPVEEITENVKEEQSVNQETDIEEKEQNEIPTEEVQEEPVEEENTEEIKEPTKNEEKIKSPIWIKIKNNRYKIILAILVILIVLGIIFIPKFKKEKEQVPVIENARMIQVVGLTSEEATQKIDELGLEIQYEYEEVDDETQIGKVLEQSIQENQEVAKGTTVTIKVAVSKQKVVVPNVVGMNINDAIQQLTAMGLPINATGQYSNDVEKDIIISQMIPEGQEINVGTTIEVLVSLGKEQVEEEKEPENPNKNNQTEINTPTHSEPQKPTTTTPEQPVTQPEQPTTEDPEQPVIPEPSKITISNAPLFIAKNKTITLNATVLPENANNKTVVWSSGNTSRATITRNGMVKAIKDGSVTITATVKGTNISTSREIIVYTPGVTGDIDGNGTVNSIDSGLILDIYLYGSDDQDRISRADINKDGVVNANDAALADSMFKYGIR